MSDMRVGALVDGASPTTAMTHIAVQESVAGNVVQWLEKVTDAQYATSPELP